MVSYSPLSRSGLGEMSRKREIGTQPSLPSHPACCTAMHSIPALRLANFAISEEEQVCPTAFLFRSDSRSQAFECTHSLPRREAAQGGPYLIIYFVKQNMKRFKSCPSSHYLAPHFVNSTTRISRLALVSSQALHLLQTTRAINSLRFAFHWVNSHCPTSESNRV